MRQTVVGIFDNESEAQKAIRELENDGFNRNAIDLSDNRSSAGGESSSDKDSGDGIGNFFRSLFGSDDDSHVHTEVAKRGCVVTVHTESSDEAERAVDILDLYGAVDVNERYNQYRSTSDMSNTSYNQRSDNDFSSGSMVGGLNSTDNLINQDDLTNEYPSSLDTDRSNYRSGDVTDLDVDRTDTDRSSYRNDDVNDRSIPIIEEDLQVGKREVETGGVRIRSRIIERPVEESLRLRTERVTVERNPVNRAVSPNDLNNFKEESYELTEHAEVPVVSKEARVVEEVRIGKDVDERVENVKDTVRKTEVDVDQYRSDEESSRFRKDI